MDALPPFVETRFVVSLVVALCLIIIALMIPKGKKAQAEEKVFPVIVGMATGNPPYCVTQADAVKVAQTAVTMQGNQEMLEKLYHNTRIETRYMGVPDFSPEQIREGDKFFYPTDGTYNVPIQTRLNKFREIATPMVVSACQKAIADAGCSLSEIHKLVVVSSTGFLGPGLDCELIKLLGLSRAIDRSLIGFMGCAAAMNGFRIADDFVRCHPTKKALLVCVEVSSVHTTFGECVNDRIIHSIFADGCAAAVIAGQVKSQMAPGTLCIFDEHSWLMEGTEDGITLAINHDGISCTLSKFLPNYIAKNMGGYVDGFLAKHNLKRSDVGFWAVHPGGRRIIEEAQNGLGLTDEQAADSWAVLAQYGNMLSPSVMFVLERVFARHREMRSRGEKGYTQGLAFSFSPGVGAEGIMLRQIVD